MQFWPSFRPKRRFYFILRNNIGHFALLSAEFIFDYSKLLSAAIVAKTGLFLGFESRTGQSWDISVGQGKDRNLVYFVKLKAIPILPGFVKREATCTEKIEKCIKLCLTS